MEGHTRSEVSVEKGMRKGWDLPLNYGNKPLKGHLGNLPSNIGAECSIPGWEAKVPHVLQSRNQNIKQKQYCNKSNKNLKMVYMEKIFKMAPRMWKVECRGKSGLKKVVVFDVFPKFPCWDAPHSALQGHPLMTLEFSLRETVSLRCPQELTLALNLHFYLLKFPHSKSDALGLLSSFSAKGHHGKDLINSLLIKWSKQIQCVILLMCIFNKVEFFNSLKS